MVDRILIVGYGSIGKRHLRLARELCPQADIRVLRHQESKDIPEFSNGCFYEIDQAIAFAPDAAVVANPATFHTTVARRLADSGAHLLIEKPLAADGASVTDLLTAVRSQGKVVLTGYNLRFMPSLRKFRELVHSDQVGRVISVRCEIGQYLPDWRPDSDYRRSVSSRKELGGGVLLELSHEIDYLRWIFGEVEQVQARVCRQSSLEIDVEDTAHLILGFAPGADDYCLIGTLNMDFVRHDTIRSCTAIGERGSLRWNGLAGTVEKFEAGANEWCAVFQHRGSRDDSYLSEWQHFLECIQGRALPLITGEDGLQVLQIIAAARRASDTGCAVQVAVHAMAL